MKSDEMAKLFDIDLEEGSIPDSADSNYAINTDKTLQSFESKCEDMKIVVESEDDIITNAMNKAAKGSNQIEELAQNPEVESEPETPDNEPESVENQPSLDPNPLNLIGSDFDAYNELQQKYPRFVLSNDSIAFKEFYKYKTMTLVSLCSKYPVLNVADYIQEISGINTDHYVGEAYIDPEILRRKIDSCYQSKTRLSAILITILEQQPAWERFCEMLRSKLWKDHELKGAHRRDGLTLEHMSDVEEYVSELKGLRDGAKAADNLLAAAAESLSRQLSCLQMKKEATGFASEEPQKQSSSQTEQFDGMDSLSDGEVIGAPKKTGKPIAVNFGVEADDDLSLLGLSKTGEK